MQDVDGDEEDDQLDETWCLFDTQLRDDDINTALASFAEGVRILMLSDSCHSGTVSRGIALDRDEKLTTASTAKRLPLDATKREFAQHAQQYHSRGVVPSVRDQGDRSPDLGLPGQPDVPGRRRQRGVHCCVPGRLAGRRFRGRSQRPSQGGARDAEGTGVRAGPNLQTVAKEDDAFKEFLAQRPLHI